MKKMRLMAMLGGLTAVFLLVFGGLAMAANPENVSVQAPVASTIRLSVSKNTVDFGGGALNPEVGSYADSLTATVRSNVLWELQVEKNRDLTGIDPANVIPSGQLTFTSSSTDGRVTATRGSATEFGLTGSPTMVAQGIRGGGMDVSVNYALTINWEDAPDTYSATHTYTVVAR
jgi:protein-disulfide isomerase